MLSTNSILLRELSFFFFFLILIFLIFFIKIIFSIKEKRIIELLFNFDFDLRRLKIRIFLKLFFIDDEPRMKFVFLINYLFFIVFFENVNVITRTLLIKLTNNKNEILQTFETRE